MTDEVETKSEAVPDEPAKEVHPTLLRLAGLLGKIEARRWIAENVAEKSAAPDRSTPIKKTDAE